MSNDSKDDTYQRLISQVNFPTTDQLSEYAKSVGIQDSYNFLNLMEKITHDRAQKRNTEEVWDIP